MRREMQCVFCTDAATSGEIVYQDHQALVILHSDWAVRGHLMIVAKRHVENVAGLPEDEWMSLARLWHRTERVLLELTGGTRSIALKLGIQTPHLHIHLYPVTAGEDRAAVFAAFDAARRTEFDAELVRQLRERLAYCGGRGTGLE